MMSNCTCRLLYIYELCFQNENSCASIDKSRKEEMYPKKSLIPKDVSARRVQISIHRKDLHTILQCTSVSFLSNMQHMSFVLPFSRFQMRLSHLARSIYWWNWKLITDMSGKFRQCTKIWTLSVFVDVLRLIINKASSPRIFFRTIS